MSNANAEKETVTTTAPITAHANTDQKALGQERTNEKNTATTEHIDESIEPDLAGVMLAEKVAAENEQHLDKFGAWAKSNPLEIALVRKLDWYMMVCHRKACPMLR